MFHPKYMGENLSSDQVEVAKKSLLMKGYGFLSTARAFQAKAPPFPESFLLATVRVLPPVTWWKGVEIQYQDLPDTQKVVFICRRLRYRSELEY